MFCSFRTWTTCHNWWNHEFCALSENPEGEYPAISLWPQAHLGYTAGQWSQTHQQVHLWMAKSILKNPNLNPIKMPWHNLEWDKIPRQRCKRLIASYRKRLFAVVAAKGGTTSYYISRAIHFSRRARQVWTVFSLNKWNCYFKTAFCI